MGRATQCGDGGCCRGAFPSMRAVDEEREMLVEVEAMVTGN